MKGILIIEYENDEMSMSRAIRKLKEAGFKPLYANPEKDRCKGIIDLIPEKPSYI